jgi:hypothetical protein
MSATIDGASWSGARPSVIHQNGVLTITALSADLATTVSISVAASAPGAYSLAYGSQTVGVGLVTKNPGGTWSTTAMGGLGTVAITDFTANHAIGTFAFDAPFASGGSGVTHVTNGKFDVTF